MSQTSIVFQTQRCQKLDAKRDEFKARPPVPFSYNIVGDAFTCPQYARKFTRKTGYISHRRTHQRQQSTCKAVAVTEIGRTRSSSLKILAPSLSTFLAILVITSLILSPDTTSFFLPLLPSKNLQLRVRVKVLSFNNSLTQFIKFVESLLPSFRVLDSLQCKSCIITVCLALSGTSINI